MIFALSSEKIPKIEGIKLWASECPYLNTIENTFHAFSVDSGISSMPLDMSDIMLWAKNRAKNLRPLIDADYYVWIEWGTTRHGEISYLGGCVYLENIIGEWHYGFSPFIEVPPYIEHLLYNEGKELWPIMQEIMQWHNVRNAEGSMAAWSEGMFPRTDEFSVAFKAAIAPFYNRFYTTPWNL